MLWWQQTLEYHGLINEAIAHINAARDSSGSSNTRACEYYLHALNKLWNAYAHHSSMPARADIPAFFALLQSIPASSEVLLCDPRTRRLAEFTPEVLDHSTLKSRGYQPGHPIPPTDLRDATEPHRKFRGAYELWTTSGADAPAVLKKLAAILYVIRSNIAHGEKTPYGPDLKKARRDEVVASVTVPVLELITDIVLGSPSQRLVVYGTLRPGHANAALLENVAGEWHSCSLRGHLVTVDGLPSFRWDPNGPSVDAMCLESKELRERWTDLDRFEGGGYRRHLVSLGVDEQLDVANCYETLRRQMSN